MTNGTATYQSTAEGLAVSGSFTLVVAFTDDALDHGDESDVYLHRLQLSYGYSYGIDEYAPDVDQVSGNPPLPFVVTVGQENQATIDWSQLIPSGDLSELCGSSLHGQMYLSLTDELADGFLDSDGYWNADQQLHWSPDPCQP